MKLLEIAVRTLCDVTAPKTADAVFLFSQTADNQASVLTAGCRLLAEKRVNKILITGSGPESGYPGYAAWSKALEEMGVHPGGVEGIDFKQTDSLNTLIEANALMRYAKRQRYRCIYVTAAPFHQIRAFMTAVTAAQTWYPDIDIYSYNGRPLAWLDRVVHSQGRAAGFRSELIGGELDRIRKYQQKGDLADDADVLGYLDNRDR